MHKDAVSLLARISVSALIPLEASDLQVAVCEHTHAPVVRRAWT